MQQFSAWVTQYFLPLFVQLKDGSSGNRLHAFCKLIIASSMLPQVVTQVVSPSAKAKPNDDEILTSRLVDRVLRPLSHQIITVKFMYR